MRKRAKHDWYRSYHFATCDCEAYRTGGRGIYRTRTMFRDITGPTLADPSWANSVKVEHSLAEVTATCKKCGFLLAGFYRMPEVEREGSNTVHELGVWIETKRTVAWAGYAVNPKTIPITDAELVERQATMLLNEIGRDFAPREDVEPIDAARRVLGREIVYGDGRTHWLQSAVEKAAQWDIRGEAIKKGYNARGLWFQDRQVIAEIEEIVACWTGRRCAGGQSYYGDWDPPYLGDATHHKLYGCRLINGATVLVRHDDIIRIVEEDEPKEIY